MWYKTNIDSPTGCLMKKRNHPTLNLDGTPARKRFFPLQCFSSVNWPWTPSIHIYIYIIIYVIIYIYILIKPKRHQISPDPMSPPIQSPSNAHDRPIFSPVPSGPRREARWSPGRPSGPSDCPAGITSAWKRSLDGDLVNLVDLGADLDVETDRRAGWMEGWKIWC